ncbi:glycosyltransferase family 2 protein [Brachyspira sp. SAP_772]|uniref:glycosyltransferase family 2 protein n=1 Tax=Brachyspira sp. SAP_772 TaxID=2608385 RepID=UPI0012F51926|nr:glycosyltransferase family 2 protein [Brachyspira sp. SAP_772]
MIKVSVVVPIYNVENYLEKCLDTIINQTLKEIEIICIDDCGKDNSVNILREYAKKDNRIKIISHKENKGLGIARNTGIKEAKGEYISFIDSDDFISKDFLYNLYNTAKKYDSDIVNTLNIKFYENKKSRKFLYTFKQREFESTWNLNDIENFYSKQAVTPYVWNKLYKTSFLLENNLYFMDIKLGIEDADFTIRLMAHKPKISFNNASIYYYRQRKDSLSSKYTFQQASSSSMFNAIIHMNNALKYYEENYPELLDEIYLKILIPITNFYRASSEKTKLDAYESLKDFYKKIHVEENKINKKNDTENIDFIEYLSIKKSKNYDEYLFNSYLLNKVYHVEKETCRSNNWFRLFGINNTKECITIVLFGIKIIIKKI